MPWLLPPPARFASAANGATNKVAVSIAAIKPRCRTSIKFSYIKIKLSSIFMQAFAANFNINMIFFLETEKILSKRLA